MTRAWIALLVAGCGSSWPNILPGETAAQAVAAAGRLNKTVGAAFGACQINQDADACRWISQYWNADYADQDKSCRGGDTGACEKAMKYDTGCADDEWIRGSGSSGGGDSPSDPVASDNADGDGCTAEPTFFPPNLVNPPRVNLAKAFEHIAIACRFHKSIQVTAICLTGSEALFDGVLNGLVFPPDFVGAKELYLEELRSEHENPDDPQHWVAQVVDQQGRQKESPTDRAARINRIQTLYANAQAKSDAFLQKFSDLKAEESIGMLNAIATGIQAGLETNAVVNGNLAAAQTNINAIVAQSREHALPVGAPPVTAVGSNAATGQPREQDQQQHEQEQQQAERAEKLKECLATDQNCEYGTSSQCKPSVIYSDAKWSDRHLLDLQITNLNMCEGNWDTVCWPKLRDALPNMAALTQQVKDVVARRLRDPADVQNVCSYYPNAADVEQGPVYCHNNRADCPQFLGLALKALQDARDLDECLYYAEFQYQRNQIKAQHDAQCQNQ